MSKASRTKGRAGQLAARKMLESHGWQVNELNSGTAVCDFIAIDPNCDAWSVEVKNAVSMNVREWRKQAIRQAGKLPWLLLCKIDGTKHWLVLRKGGSPITWEAMEE
jgi:hypothetical protein